MTKRLCPGFSEFGRATVKELLLSRERTGDAGEAREKEETLPAGIAIRQGILRTSALTSKVKGLTRASITFTSRSVAILTPILAPR